MVICDTPEFRAVAYMAPEGESLCAGETDARKRELLREVLSADDEDVEIGHTPDGAPRLTVKFRSMPVSVSHSRRTLMIAISKNGGRLGIDTETPDRVEQLKRIACRFIGDGQEMWGEEHRLLRAWTIKEALYKAAGIAGWALRAIPLPADGELPAIVETPCGQFRLIAAELPEEAGAATIAIELR